MSLLWLLLDSRPVRAFRALSGRNKSFLLALIVAFALRLAWVIVATRTPVAPLGDATEYLRMADDFSRGHLPTFISGEPTAFYAPGYALLLVPFLWLSQLTAWVSPAFAASLVNAVAATVTVAATGHLAGRWISPASRNPAAWIMAVAPAHIYLTSTAHAESVFAPMVLVGLIVITRIIERAGPTGIPVRQLAAVGIFIGFAMLVRSPGMALLVAAALVLRTIRGSWKGALRATGALLAGAAVILLPWAVITGLHVGAWTPFSTQNATVLCVGHHDEATGGFPTPQPRSISEDCYPYSPFDDSDLGLAPSWWTYHHPDEARWYREASARGIHWALTHPGDEVWLVHQKFVRSWGTEWDALPLARNYEEQHWAGRATGPLDGAANIWLWAVEALTVVGLLTVRACRRAMPIWALGAIFSLFPIAGLAHPHFRHPAIPFLVVLAGGAVAAIRHRLHGGPYDPGDQAVERAPSAGDSAADDEVGAASA